ncbi:hypothetical protein D9M69_480980 [compost metagenome]
MIDAAVQLIPLNFVALDAGYSDLGEVSDYIPEIVFTALIGDQAWLSGNEDKLVAFLLSLIEATALLYDSSNDETVLPVVMEITQSDLRYARKSLDYMREMSVFARSLEIPVAAFDKTLELMTKAGLLDPAAQNAAKAVVDDTWAQSALQASRSDE